MPKWSVSVRWCRLFCHGVFPIRNHSSAVETCGIRRLLGEAMYQGLLDQPLAAVVGGPGQLDMVLACLAPERAAELAIKASAPSPAALPTKAPRACAPYTPRRASATSPWSSAKTRRRLSRSVNLLIAVSAHIYSNLVADTVAGFEASRWTDD